jgi:hypothetical protein
MTSNQLIDLMNRQPFKPFSIHLSDGSKIDIDEPFQIATRRNSPTCVVYESPERTRMVALRNVTEVVIESTGQSSG